MGKKLYVGNLSYESTEQELEAAFGEYGALEEVAIIYDRETGRSKGFAFVTYVEDAPADQAIEKLNGTDLGGRSIRVAEARPRQPRRQYDSW